MSIFKRGSVYWFHFLFDGKHVQRSTKQGNPRIARNIAAAYRTALAKGEVGITERKKIPAFKAAMADMPRLLAAAPEIIHVEAPGEGWSSVSEGA